MSEKAVSLLLLGEVFLDFTVTPPGSENKLRFGGIAHAARGLWALGVPFRAAAVLPKYLEDSARAYFEAFGCSEFRVIGIVNGAPNVTIIFDATEVADQGYDTLMRDEKTVRLIQDKMSGAPDCDVLIFPGSFDLKSACALLPENARLHLDVAYDVADPNAIVALNRSVETILISTSSTLFRSIEGNGGNGVHDILQAFSVTSPSTLILKENRGGSRLLCSVTNAIEALPAQLGNTVNSVGVGDVFAATYVSNLSMGKVEAAWRATYAAAAYSQTTDPNLFRTYVERDGKLSLEDMKGLWGTSLPWERRRTLQIYLAAPDFLSANRIAIERSLASLNYHNFVVRRPVMENGELRPGSDGALLSATYQADYALLKASSLVFAVPTGRDPGTLVEIGIAIEARMPVVVFDPAGENANTMVMAGAYHYSTNLDSCLNAVFRALGEPESSP